MSRRQAGSLRYFSDHSLTLVATGELPIGQWALVIPRAARSVLGAVVFFVAPVVAVVGVILDAAGGETVEDDAEDLVFAGPERLDVKADVFAEGAVETADVDDLVDAFGDEQGVGDGAERRPWC